MVPPQYPSTNASHLPAHGQGADVPGGADCLWSKQEARDGQFKSGFRCDNDDTAPGVKGSFGGQNCYCNRLVVKAQVSALDEAVGNLTRSLQASEKCRTGT